MTVRGAAACRWRSGPGRARGGRVLVACETVSPRRACAASRRGPAVRTGRASAGPGRSGRSRPGTLARRGCGWVRCGHRGDSPGDHVPVADRPGRSRPATRPTAGRATGSRRRAPYECRRRPRRPSPAGGTRGSSCHRRTPTRPRAGRRCRVSPQAGEGNGVEGEEPAVTPYDHGNPLTRGAFLEVDRVTERLQPAGSVAASRARGDGWGR